MIHANILAIVLLGPAAMGATNQPKYYAHPAVLDRQGVIAPWYSGQNGQLDWRVRIAAETLKRYPWVGPPKAPIAAPEYMYNGAWKIAADGTITVPPISDWANGDLGQRAAYVLGSLIDYYRYSGDPAAIAHLTIQADLLLELCQTPPDHPWPGFLISVPVCGKPYGPADPKGWIQLDIVAEVGIQMVRASELTGNRRWFEAACRWGDLLAEKRCREPGLPPWPRYANPRQVPWEDHSAGGIAFILEFLDTLIQAGHRGRNGAIVEAREAGVAYLNGVLLPDWLGHDTWGRNYWDWPCNVQVENVTEFAARYLIEHPGEFPGWAADARNILTLFINRTCAAPTSAGDTFSGAWAYPESSGCCGRSLWYGPLELAGVYAQYAATAGSDWAAEMARRQIILATYDAHETGVVEDNIDGGAVVAGDWFKIAHPMALKHVLNVLAWMPETFGAARENHMMRSSGVVRSVTYGDARVEYSTVRGVEPAIEVLRLAFAPAKVTCNGQVLNKREALDTDGYTVKPLACGDCIVTVRHAGPGQVAIEGDDPQTQADTAILDTAAAGVEARVSVEGNQARLIGRTGPDGGLAEVYLDDVRQLCGIDCWCPQERDGVVWSRSGLAAGPHTIRLVAKGAGNLRSSGRRVRIAGVQSSTAVGDNGFGEGGGPRDAQRWIFGYPRRSDYTDAQGNTWRPATEFVIRSGNVVDTVAAAWWTDATRLTVEGTPDPELYRHGVHGREFWADFTVGPGTYHVRTKFLESRNVEPAKRAVTIAINGREVAAAVDLAATATGVPATSPARPPALSYVLWPGLGRPVDLVFNGIEPFNGVISIRLKGSFGGEAIVQAVEVGPGDGGEGAKPISVPTPASAPASGAASDKK